MTFDVDFTASDFQVGSGGDPAPVDPVIGSFRVTLDPAVAVMNNTADISLQSLNITLGSALSFNYDPAVNGGRLEVGGIASGPSVITFNPSTNDFWLFITNFMTTPVFDQVGYTQTSVSNNNLFFTLDQTGTVEVSAVPEPSSLFLGIAGLAATGAVQKRRRKRAPIT